MSTVMIVGEGGEAAMVLLRCGRIDDAVACARKTLQEVVIAKCLLVHSRVVMSRSTEETYKKATIQDLEEAVAMFQTCNDMSGLGEAELHLAELTGDEKKVELAWKAFAKLKPFQNEAGLVECTDWLIRHDKLKKIGPVRSSVKGVGHVFEVCRVFLETSGQENQEKMRLFEKFYGLSSCGPTELQVNRKEKPICLPMMKDLIKGRPQKKTAQVQVSRLEAHEAIVGYLLRRAFHWLKPVWDSLFEWRERCESCPYTVSGMKCPTHGSSDKPCRKLHKNQDRESYQKLIQCDILIVEFEYNVQSGAKKLLRKCRANLEKSVEMFIYPRGDPLEIRYKACKMLWDDIMPSLKYPDCIGNEREFVKYLTDHDKDKVRFRMRDFILDSWYSATAGDKKLKSDAVKSTDVFLLLDFGSRVFSLIENIRGLEKIEPAREITKLEARVTSEVREKEKLREFQIKIKKYYTLMSDTDKITQQHIVQCFARRFSEAYTQMSENSDPFDAVYKFSKFCHLLITRGNPKFLPDLKHFLFWVEFYCTLAFLIIAKVNSKNFPDFVFIVPANYFSVIKFVEATFPKYTVEEVMAWWKPGRFMTALKVQERLKFIVWLISGLGTDIKLFQNAFERPDNPEEFAIAERLLVLGMTLICNVGKTVPLECEISLVKEICSLNFESRLPPRLQNVVETLRNANGIKDFAVALRAILQERDMEMLVVCQWSISGKIERIRKEPLKDEMLFSEYFLNAKTLPALRGLDATSTASEFIKSAEEGELSDDEIEKGRRDQENQSQYAEKQRAATVIVRHVRKYLRRRRNEKLATIGYRKGAYSNVAQTFDEIQVDAVMCGICGVSFEHQLKDILDRESINWSSGQVETQRQNSAENRTDLQSIPSSPESVEKSPEGKGLMNWIASKIPFIQSPTLDTSQSGVSPKQPTTDLENRQLLLEKIKKKHCQETLHLQKRFDFHKFKKDYTEGIFPKVDKVKEFLNNPEYELQAVVTDNYTEMRMDINRLFGKINELQRLVEAALARKAWSEIGRLQQVNRTSSRCPKL